MELSSAAAAAVAGAAAGPRVSVFGAAEAATYAMHPNAKYQMLPAAVDW
jgi:hypothetical protein